jgi:predicted nuclease of predicted toxin-antitoxin system
MKLLIDMNLSPLWVEHFERAGLEAVHWSSIGRPAATDAEIMSFAREHGRVVFTHDLDFSALLAHTQAGRPSVLQLRAKDVLPAACGPSVTRIALEHAADLEAGAIVTIDTLGARVRTLPIGSRE